MFIKLTYKHLFIFFSFVFIIFLLHFQCNTFSKKVTKKDGIKQNNIQNDQHHHETIITETNDKFSTNNNKTLNTDNKNLERKEILEEKEVSDGKTYREFHLDGLKKYMYHTIKRDMPDSRFIDLFGGIIENDFDRVFDHVQLSDLTKLNDKEVEILIRLIGYFTTDLDIFDLLFQNIEFSLFSDTHKDISDYALKYRNFILLNSLINRYDLDINKAEKKHSLKMQCIGIKELEDWINQYDAQFNQYDYDNCDREIFCKVRELKTLKIYLDAGFKVSDDMLSHLMIRGHETSEEAIEFYEFIFSVAKNPSSLYKHTNLIVDDIIHKKTDVETIRYLVTKGYSLYGKNNYSQNALDVATYYKNSEIIIYLLDNGFSADQKIKIRDHYDFDARKIIFKEYENLYSAAEALHLKDVLRHLEKGRTVDAGKVTKKAGFPPAS